MQKWLEWLCEELRWIGGVFVGFGCVAKNLEIDYTTHYWAKVRQGFTTK